MTARASGDEGCTHGAQVCSAACRAPDSAADNTCGCSDTATDMDAVAESADAFCIFTTPVPNGIQLPPPNACTAGADWDAAEERGGVGA